MLARVGADIDPRARLRDLGIANKHLVAVARALSIDARVVIMDEPTAALSHKEIAELFALVEKLKAEGKAILFISHKFDEIFRIADRYTVFRDGRMVGEGLMAEVSEDALVTHDGRPQRSTPSSPSASSRLGEEVLQVAGYSHPTEFEFDRLHPAQGRDPRLLRPGRRRPQRGDAGALRHHPALARRRQDRRPDRGHPQPGRGDRPRHRLRARGPRRARARSAGCRSSRTSPCRRSPAPRAAASCAWPRSSASPASTPAASTCAPPRSTRTSASSPAATSRRW